MEFLKYSLKINLIPSPEASSCTAATATHRPLLTASVILSSPVTTVGVFTPLHTAQMAPSNAPYQAVLSPDLLAKFKHLNDDSENINYEVSDDTHIVGPNSDANIMVLSTLLVLGLTTNLLAFPVIMFRRTKFGNGQFAVLVLCLTVSDLLTVCCGLVGGLVLEVGHMSWAGSTISCSIYCYCQAQPSIIFDYSIHPPTRESTFSHFQTK